MKERGNENFYGIMILSRKDLKRLVVKRLICLGRKFPAKNDIPILYPIHSKNLTNLHFIYKSFLPDFEKKKVHTSVIFDEKSVSI